MCKQVLDRNGDTPSGKLGAKFLDENQFRNTFPNWKSLLARINEQRSISKYAYDNELDVFFENSPQMYDNVYAILGGRGSGKSSVLLTIRKCIQKENPQDIVLPIVTPESISTGSILGWLMSLVDLEIVRMERKIEEINRVSSSAGVPGLDTFFDDCRFKKKNPLRREYEELCLLIADVCDGEKSREYLTGEAAYHHVDRSRKQYRLIRELNHFWKHLAETATLIRRHGSTQDSCYKESTPLIILSFDDIDLAPERSMELLTTTFQYLTAPNIVIILSASEHVLQQVIQIRMLERVLASDSPSVLTELLYAPILSSDSLQTIGDGSRMMEEFYNKVIPPARRFYLKKFKTLRDRKNYYYSSTKQCFYTKDSDSGHAIAIDTLLKEQIDVLISALNESCFLDRVRTNFLSRSVGGAGFNDAYLLIFGEKNRSIVNGCLAVINTVSQLCEIVRVGETPWVLNLSTCEDVLAVLRQLLTTLLQAKQEIIEFDRDNIDQLIYADTETRAIHVNYPFVLERYIYYANDLVLDAYDSFFEQKSQTDDMDSVVDQMKKLKKHIVCVMMMLLFVENIISLLESNERPLHGCRELGLIINSASLTKLNIERDCGVLRVFPLHFDIQEVLDHSSALLEHIDFYVNADLYDPIQTQKFLLDAVGGYSNADAAVQALIRAMIWDRDWVKTVLMMLDLYGSDITLSDRSMIEISRKTQNTLEHFAFGGEFKWDLEIATFDYIRNYNLEEHSKELISKFIAEKDAKVIIQNLPSVFAQSSLLQTEDDSGLEVITLEERFSELSNLAQSKENGEDINQGYAQLVTAFWNVTMRSSLQYQSQDQQLLLVSYQIQDFFKEYLNGVLRDILANTFLTIPAHNVEEIIQIISDVDLYSPGLRQAKINLENQLHQLLQVKQQEQLLDGEDCFAVSPVRFIHYLDFLNEALVDEAKENEGFVYDLSNEKQYASLQGYLTLVDKPDCSFQKTIPFQEDIPATSRIALVVNMLRSIFKYYIAACVLITKDKRINNSFSQSTHPLHGYLNNIFCAVKKADKETVGLEKLMVQAHDELVQHYYNRMEEMNE